MDAPKYVISFLIDNSEHSELVFYGDKEKAPSDAQIIIIPSNFFDEGIYGTNSTIPKTPFAFLPDTDIPFLFGEPCIEKTADGKIILYADLVASAYFMLSRYEEIIKPDCRDQYDRFLAKDSVVFQQGYGSRPLVDEWGRYLRNLLRESGIEMPEEKHGFSKIYLTHDVDIPFYIFSFKSVIGETARNISKRNPLTKNPLKSYFFEKYDPYYTFPWIISQDNELKSKRPLSNIESIYFLISAKSTKKNKYFPVNSVKYRRLLNLLIESGAKLGLHVSHEGGDNPKLIKNEISRLPECVDKENLLSRHHYLKWREPVHLREMEKAGIKDDFTLGYADSVGFRCGTCRPFKLINPDTKEVSNITEHPLLIMECSLSAKQYMNLDENESIACCKKIIDMVFDFYGELDILFHNSSFAEYPFNINLYQSILSCINNKYKQTEGI